MSLACKFCGDETDFLLLLQSSPQIPPLYSYSRRQWSDSSARSSWHYTVRLLFPVFLDSRRHPFSVDPSLLDVTCKRLFTHASLRARTVGSGRILCAWRTPFPIFARRFWLVPFLSTLQPVHFAYLFPVSRIKSFPAFSCSSSALFPFTTGDAHRTGASALWCSPSYQLGAQAR